MTFFSGRADQWIQGLSEKGGELGRWGGKVRVGRGGM